MKSKHIKTSIAVFAGIVVIGCAMLATAEESPSQNIFLDSDQDRLSNEEEAAYGTNPENNDSDGDGYSDGAEVESGYDPLIPAPGDRTAETKEDATNESSATENSTASGTESSAQTTDQQTSSTDTSTATDSSADDGKNLTEELSLQVTDLMTSNAQGEQEINLGALNSVIEQTMNNDVDFTDLPEISEEDIKIKKQDYKKMSDEEKQEKIKEDDIEYLVSVAYLAASNSPKKVTSPTDILDMTNDIMSRADLYAITLSDTSFFDDYAEKGGAVINQLKDVEVPENFVDKHIKGLKLANYAFSLKDKAKPDMNDPIRSIQNLSEVQGAIGLAMEFGNEIVSELGKLGIAEIPLDL